MGRSVSYPTQSAWVFYTQMEHDARRFFVCKKCDHTHYERDDEPGQCEKCGNIGFDSYPEHDELFEWECLVDNIQDALKKAFPSMQPCDRWLNREDHAILCNGHVWMGVSEYCGLVAIWCVPRDFSDYEPDQAQELHLHWANRIKDKAERALTEVVELYVPINHWVLRRARAEPALNAA